MEHYRRALAIYEAKAPGSLDVAGTLSNIGAVLQDQGDLDGAAPLLREALEAMRETLGDRHPHTLTSINNLGWLLQGPMLPCSLNCCRYDISILSSGFSITSITSGFSDSFPTPISA